MRSRIIIAAGCILAILIVAAILTSTRRSDSITPSFTETKKDKEQRLRTIREQWDAEPVVSLISLSEGELADQLTAALQQPLADLKGKQRDVLIEQLAKQLIARAAGISDPYIELAATDPTTEWTTPSDESDWDAISTWYEYIEGVPPPAAISTQALLDKFVSYQLRQERGTLIGVALGPQGLRADTFRIRSKDQIDFLLHQQMSSENLSYWFENNGHGGMWFRRPDLSVEQIINRDSAALVTNLCMLVQTEDARAFNWNTTWYWDPKRSVWLCDRMARKGWHAYMYY